VIVCIDGCFTQKRRKGRGECDRTLDRPYTVFLTPEILDAMKTRVEQRRSSKKSTSSRVPTRSRVDEGEEEDEVDVAEYGDWVDDNAVGDDYVEPGMRVPASALDACHESFTAADEARQKASNSLFSDTGLTALLCEHDRVIYLCNMQTPGEAQYYALALLDELFKGLPPNATVGVLYDIGCQLHRSIVKVSSYIPLLTLFLTDCFL
jgi:hypothetical protein